MKKYTLIFCFIVWGICGQEKEINKSYVESKLSNFTVKNNKIQGEGKKMILKMIQESQFVVFGESHYSKQTSILTKALIPLLAKSSYTDFVAEIGPNSAQKLEELSNETDLTVEKLRDFNTKYKKIALGESADPIPFFAGVEDAEFLSEIRKQNMKIHGIDQEYYYSVLFFLDELVQLKKNENNYNQIVSLKEKANKKIFDYLMARKEEKIKNALGEILKDDDVITFFNQFTSNDIKAMKIIEDLKLSWDIYIRWRQDSHVDRISYMRNNLYEIFNKNRKAKMFIKLGSLHASKIISNGAYDIGNYTEELAEKNNTVSSSINSWRPFVREGEVVNDNLKKYKKFYGRLSLFTQFAKKNEWTIINLKEIREDVKLGRIKLPENGDLHSLKKVIEGYDYQLILPVDESIMYNLNQKNEK